MKELRVFCNSQEIACREEHDLHHSVCCYHCAKEEINKLQKQNAILLKAVKFCSQNENSFNNFWSKQPNRVLVNGLEAIFNVTNEALEKIKEMK